MVTLRFAVPAILAAAAAAGCFSYFVATPERVEADVRLPPAVLYSTGPNTRASTTDQPLNADERAAAAFQKAAEAILRRAPNARASAGADEPPITEPISLPKRRPITRP
jgi:hypothetical protein